MSEWQLKTELTNDPSQFNQAMDESTEKVEKFDKKVKTTQKDVDNLGKKGAMSTRELLAEIGKMTGAEKGLFNYRKQLSQITREIQDLTINYSAMSKEMQNSDIGRAALQKIQELTVQAGQYKDAIIDAQNSIKVLASDTAAWDGIKQGINTASSALQGFVSLGVLGEKSTEGLVKVIAKLKGIEAATNSVIQVGNALQKQSALMMGISAIQSKALAKAKELETVATGKATIAQRIFNTVAKANPYVLLVSVILAAGAALFTFSKLLKSSKDETDLATKAQKGYNKALKDSKSEAAGSIAKFQLLRTQYNGLKTDAERTQWIENNKDKFAELGVELNNIADAQKWLVDNAESFIKALTLEAEAAALMSYYEEEYKKGIEESIKAQEKQSKTSSMGPTKEQRKSGQFKEGVDYISHTTTHSSSAGSYNQTIYEWTPEGKEKAEKFGEKAAESVLDGYTEALTPAAKLAAQKLADAKTLRNASTPTPKTDPNSGNKGGSGGNKDKERELQNQLAIQKQLKDELEKEIPYLKEGTEEYDNQVRKILEVEAEIQRLQSQYEGFIARIKNESLGELPKLPGISGKVEIQPLSNDAKVQIYNNAKQVASTYQEYLDLGLIGEQEAKAMIDRWNKTLKQNGIKAEVGIEIKADKGQKIEVDDSVISQISSQFDQITNMVEAPVNAINSVVNAFKNLQETLEDPDASGWEQFFAVFQAGTEVLSAMSTVLNIVNTVQEMLNATKQKSIQKTTQEMAVEQAQIGVKQMNAGASIGEALAEGAATSTKGAGSVASIPYVGAFMAIAMLATIMASVLAVISQAKGFATGGVVGGNSYTGDKILARLNSGELVLNQDQQNKLLNMNEQTVVQSGAYINIPDKITLTAHGKDLQATLINVNKYNSKI